MAPRMEDGTMPGRGMELWHREATRYESSSVEGLMISVLCWQRTYRGGWYVLVKPPRPAGIHRGWIISLPNLRLRAGRRHQGALSEKGSPTTVYVFSTYYHRPFTINTIILKIRIDAM